MATTEKKLKTIELKDRSFFQVMLINDNLNINICLQTTNNEIYFTDIPNTNVMKNVLIAIIKHEHKDYTLETDGNLCYLKIKHKINDSEINTVITLSKKIIPLIESISLIEDKDTIKVTIEAKSKKYTAITDNSEITKQLLNNAMLNKSMIINQRIIGQPGPNCHIENDCPKFGLYMDLLILHLPYGQNKDKDIWSLHLHTNNQSTYYIFNIYVSSGKIHVKYKYDGLDCESTCHVDSDILNTLRNIKNNKHIDYRFESNNNIMSLIVGYKSSLTGNRQTVSLTRLEKYSDDCCIL